jgi:hypothetical protein
MKRFLLTVFFIFGIMAFSAKAQITVTQEDFPVIGNLVVRAVDDVTTVSPGNPGLNQVWDYSNLVASRYDSMLFLPPQWVPGHEKYPEANMVYSLMQGASTSSYSYNFINATPLGRQWIGDETYSVIWASMTLSMHIKYTPAPYGLPLPFTYGNNSTQDFVMDWTMAMNNAGVLLDSTRHIRHTNMSMLADASGTMITPNGSFPVLRVKELINMHDSTFNWTAGNWVFDSDTSYSWTQYRWYANDLGEVGYYYADSKKEGGGFSFFASETFVGIKDVISKPAFGIYPNPAQSMITIESNEKINRVDILDVSGKIKQVGHISNLIDISRLTPGMYIVNIFSTSGVSTSTFIKQ